jgi:hypothetical protein
MLICAVVVALAIVLISTGSSAVFLLFPIACAAMMLGMMWMMMRPRGKDHS